MKQRLLSFFALAALTMSAMAQSWTAPVEPTPIEPLDFGFTHADYEVGGTYYIQNVGTGQFVTGANNWATQISVSSNGIPYVSLIVEEVTDAGYEDCIKLKLNGSFKFDGNATGNYRKDYAVADKYLFRDGEENGFVDRNNQPVWYWFFEKAESGNYYWHSAPGMGDNKFPNAADQYASVTGPGVGVNFSTGIEAANNEWCFIPLESVDLEAVNAAQEEYNIKLAAYNKADSLYKSRLILFEMLNEAVKYSADYTEASAVYNNEASTIAEVDTAAAHLRKLIAVAILPYAKANSTVEAPVELTKYIITNPDFNAGNIDGWTVTAGIGQNQGYQANSSYKNAEGEVVVDKFIEAWRPAPSTLNDGQIYQKLGALPSGHYILECDGIARNQTADTDENYVDPDDYKGIYLFYNDGNIVVHSDATLRDVEVEVEDAEGNVTTERRAAHFTFEFDIEDVDSLKIGLMAEQTNLNWMAADNFKLSMAGPSQILPSYTALRAELKTAEALLEEDIMAQKTLIDALQTAVNNAAPLVEAASDDAKDAEYKAAYAEINGARQAVVESVAAYAKLSTFIEQLDTDIEKYDEKAGYDALVAKLTNLQTELTTGYDNQTISTEEINAKIDGYADMIAADIQKLFDDAVAAGEPIEEGLDISPLFKDMTFAYGTTQTAFANGYPAENPVWMNETKTGNFKTNYSTAEVWDARPFNIYRDLENLPKGKYTVKTHAFYRAAANDTNYPGYQNGDYDATEYAYIYAGANHTHLVNNAALGTPTAKTGDWDAGDGNYIPNSQQGAHELFTDPAYAEQAALAYIEVSGNVLADGGTLRVGFAGTNELQANHWCIFDGFEIYYNGIPETLDGEIEALIAELEAYAPFVVETTTLYNEALAAASAALGADRETQVAVIAQLEEAIAACKLSEELYNKLFDTVLPEYEKKRDDSYGTGTFTDETLATILQEIQDAQKDDQIQSNEQMQGWIDALPVAWVNYILSMEELDDATEANPIVVPIIVNGDFETGNKNGWTVEQQGNAGGDGNGAAEFWGATSFDIYQEFPKLKDGYWRLSVDALYRYGGSASDCNARAAGTITNPEYFYINDLAVNVVSWSDLERGAFRYTGEKDDDGNDITPYDLAIDNNALIKYDVTPAEGEPYSFWSVNTKTGFELVINLKDEDEKPVNRFHNEIVFGYGEGLDVTGAVRLGLKKAEKPSSDNDWCPFDNFKLEYLGTEAPVAVTSLEAEPAKAMTGALYSIDGRIVRNVTSAADLRGLSRGIYIIGGKKVTIK